MSVNIMATIGPTFQTKELFIEGIKQGCNYFRLPCGYRENPHAQHVMLINEAKKITGKNVNVVADLPSARPRFGKIIVTNPEMKKQDEGEKYIPIKEGDTFYLFNDNYSGENLQGFYIDYFNTLVHYFEKSKEIFLLDGRIRCKISKVTNEYIMIIITKGEGKLKTRNSIVFDIKDFEYETVVDKDIKLLKSLEEQGTPADWVIFSMIQTPNDIQRGKEKLSKNLKHPPKIMAKIEREKAVVNINEIVKESDAVLIGRGDLTFEIKYEQLPNIQKKIIDICKLYQKDCFVATQCLESFASEGMPLRAELLDLGCTKWLGANGIMLGKETVFSSHPIESIELARKTFEETQLLDLSFIEAAKINQSNLVAIEGPDGVGKTTLCNHLKSKGYKIKRGIPKQWEEPNLKKLMINPKKWISGAFYFLSGVIENDNNEDRTTISDRSIWSSIVVHYKQNTELLEELCKLLSLVCNYINFPRKVIVLNPGFTIAHERIMNKSDDEKEFDLQLPQKEVVYNNEIYFFKWLERLGLDITFIDSNCDIYTLTNEIIQIMEK